MMVQIIEHHAETSVDFAVEGEAASSTPQVPNRPVPGTAANISDSIEGFSGGIIGIQGFVVTPSKLHGLTGGHEAMAGRRRPTTRYGTFYLDQVEDAVIPVPTRGVSICVLALSKGCTNQRPPGRTQP
jgi:hypothetical protein